MARGRLGEWTLRGIEIVWLKCVPRAWSLGNTAVEGGLVMKIVAGQWIRLRPPLGYQYLMAFTGHLAILSLLSSKSHNMPSLRG